MRSVYLGCIRDEVEDTHQPKHELCVGDTEGAEEPANTIDEGVMTPWWLEADEAAEFDRCGVWCGGGTTAFLRVDVAGSQC